MTPQYASELTHRMFERYLSGQGVRWESIPTGNVRTPDYLLTSITPQTICEVKTIVGTGRMDLVGHDPCKPIARKIRKAVRQLDAREERPRFLLLHSQSLSDSLDPVVVASTAFGPGFRLYQPDHSAIDGRPPVLKFLRKHELPESLHRLSKPCLSRDSNTRISAIVILQSYVLGEQALAVWKLCRMRHSRRYAESQPMPSPTTTVQESRPGAQQIVGVQLPLF